MGYIWICLSSFYDKQDILSHESKEYLHTWWENFPGTTHQILFCVPTAWETPTGLGGARGTRPFRMYFISKYFFSFSFHFHFISFTTRIGAVPGTAAANERWHQDGNQLYPLRHLSTARHGPDSHVLQSDAGKFPHNKLAAAGGGVKMGLA